MKDLTCPYCDHEFDVCHDDGFGYEEGEAHHQECPNCKKNFVFQTYISLSYSTRVADCLNGAEHTMRLSSTYPKEHSRMRCSYCDFSRRATADEIAAQVKP